MSPFIALFLFLASAFAQITYQNSSGTILRVDNGTYGVEAEEFHYYYDQWPIGLAVSSSGRLFVCYTRGTYDYTLGEAVNKTAGKMFSCSCANSSCRFLPSEVRRNTCLEIKSLELRSMSINFWRVEQESSPGIYRH